MSVWLVNANVFSEFGATCGTMVVSELRRRLQSDEVGHQDIFMPAQGLNAKERKEIYNLARSVGREHCLRQWDSDLNEAPSTLTHKKRSENTLISTPRKHGTAFYQSDLLIAADNELILDHVTGQHVQGMVLVEACRQMFIAVSELTHMDAVDHRKDYVIFNSMNVEFKAFTYPLPAHIWYKDLSLNSNKADRVRITAELTVIQNDTDTMQVIVDYTLFEKAVMRGKEIEKGKQAVNKYCQRQTQDSNIEADGRSFSEVI
jgi:A-factor biosynthesis hotdog domain